MKSIKKSVIILYSRPYNTVGTINPRDAAYQTIYAKGVPRVLVRAQRVLALDEAQALSMAKPRKHETVLNAVFE